jgi:hypothetical protein
MQIRSKTIAPALKALVERSLDYAGAFPPAALSIEHSLENYNSYQNGPDAWMLRWLVVSSATLRHLPESVDGKLSVLTDQEEVRAACIESKTIVTAKRPVYCEVPIDNLSLLGDLKRAGCFAKVRTGGVQAELIPPPEAVAAFINACAELRLPFKATAGLHHPVRAEYALTYEQGAPRAIMHGFLNVLLASAFAWQGVRDIEPILLETDPKAFSFDELASWRDKSLKASEIIDARQNFIHSFGSCSFEEPVHELQSLGLL